MTQELKELIQGYVERCIPDIARKCGCTVDNVAFVMAEVADNKAHKAVSIPKDKTIEMSGHDYTFEEVMELFSK